MILPSQLYGLPVQSTVAGEISLLESGFVQEVSDDSVSDSNIDFVSFEIVQGNTLIKEYQIKDNQTLAGWSCRVQVRDITRSNLYFDELVNFFVGRDKYIVNIPADLTNTMPVGLYVIAAQFDNNLSHESREVSEVFRIKPQWVY